MTDANEDRPAADRWQKARQSAAKLSLDLPTPAPGTAIYICTEGPDHRTLVLLRAFARAAARAGHRVKLLN